MSIKSKHSAGKNEKSGKRGKRKKLEDSEDLESSEEELDLTKDCHPIGYYVNDRAEMINQMFSVIKGNKLKAMLPPILKDCDIELLKLQCLDQLLGMSEKRIACILDGETLETSSESDVESNDYDSDDRNKKSSTTNSDGSDECMEVELQEEMEKRPKRKGKKKVSLADDEKSLKTCVNESDRPAAEQGKTLLEILELEMRARAIRALLKQNEITQDGNNTEPKVTDSKENGVKEISDEVVDLTGCEDDEFPVNVKKENFEDDVMGEKVLTCEEEKVEKPRSEKRSEGQEREKAKRLQAELELRNKLFKKKIYRTRQQRMENEEEDKITGLTEEPVRSDEIRVEDPEEGEVSSSEDGAYTDVKQEVVSVQPELHSSHVGARGQSDCQFEVTSELTTPLSSDKFSDCVTNTCSAGQVNSDSGNISSNKGGVEDEVFDSRECLNLESEDDVLNIDSQDINNSPLGESDEFRAAEETSWRERWLRKDGVQKLVKSSKIYAKVKKRIAEKSQRSKEDVNAPSEAKSEPNSLVKLEIIEGSIKEYEKLSGKSLQTSEEISEEALDTEKLAKSASLAACNKNDTDNCDNSSSKNKNSDNKDL